VLESAIPTKRVTLKESKVILGSLVKLGVREALSASLAAEGLRLTQRVRDDVNTPACRRAVLEVLAFTLLFPTEADFVDAGAVVLTRDDPAAEPPVEPDLVGQLGVELADLALFWWWLPWGKQVH
jgi:hypothetical protein